MKTDENEAFANFSSNEIIIHTALTDPDFDKILRLIIDNVETKDLYIFVACVYATAHLISRFKRVPRDLLKNVLSREKEFLFEEEENPEGHRILQGAIDHLLDQVICFKLR